MTRYYMEGKHIVFEPCQGVVHWYLVLTNEALDPVTSKDPQINHDWHLFIVIMKM